MRPRPTTSQLTSSFKQCLRFENTCWWPRVLPPVYGGVQFELASRVWQQPSFGIVSGWLQRLGVNWPSFVLQVLSHSFSGAIGGPLNSRPHGSADDDDDFSSLIIPPPPPSSSTPQAEEVAVVPPVPKEAREKRRHFRHKRSSSVDIGSLNLAKQQLQEAEKRRSLDLQDSRKGEGGSIRRPTPPHDLSGVDQRFDCDSHDGLSAESPATVSMRLHNLLKSLPNFAPEAALADQQQAPFFRTGSLRIYRSASCELTGGTGAGRDQQKSGNEAARAFTGKPTSRTFFSGTASLGRNSGRRAVSHEHLISGVGGGSVGGGVGSKAGDSHSGQQQQQQQQTPAESFASLKAKLKDYRDHLLKRASLSRKASDESVSEGGDRKAGKSSLRRSNSFSRLLSQLSGRRGSRSLDSAAAEDGNWTLRDRRSASGESSSTGDLLSLFVPPGGEEEKRGVPVVRETLAVSRTSLRPVSTSSGTAQVRLLLGEGVWERGHGNTQTVLCLSVDCQFRFAFFFSFGFLLFVCVRICFLCVRVVRGLAVVTSTQSGIKTKGGRKGTSEISQSLFYLCLFTAW